MGEPKTLTEAIRYFADFENCREYLVARRWPNGVTCPTCGSKAVYYDRTLKGWKCKTKHPQQKFTLKTGSIFEDSPLGFDKWLPAVWLITNCKNGVSSWELHRALGVTQKTAWFMLHRIRLAMQDDNSGGKPGGDVEVDETYIGGKARNMHHKKSKRLGITQRPLDGGQGRGDGVCFSVTRRRVRARFACAVWMAVRAPSARYRDEQAFRFNLRTGNDALSAGTAPA
jgi:transposase-like protein